MPFGSRAAFTGRRATGPAPGAARPLRSLAAAGAVLVLAVAAAAFLLAKDLYDGTVRDTQRDLSSFATVLAEQADRVLQAIELVQQAVADDIADPSVRTEEDFVRRASTLALHEQLRARIAALPQVAAITIVDPRGHLVNYSRRWPIPEGDISDRPYFRTLITDPAMRRIVSPPLESRGDGTRTVFIARKVTAPDGRILGVVLGAIELGYFENLYGRVAPGPSDVISMFRTDGTLVVRYPLRPDAIGRAFPSAGAFKVLSVNPSGSGVTRTTSPIDGQDRIIAVQALGHYPLVLSASRTAAAALAAWREQAAALGVAVALLVAGLGALVSMGMRQIRGQQRLVLSEAARVAAEERARGERRLREEYARFGTALDSMSQGLCLFDGEGRLVVLNARFALFYGVPDALCRPGTPLDALLGHIRGAVGTAAGERFAADLAEAAAAARPAVLTCGLADGRILGVSAAPVAGGGWVCTCEDETERRRSEATIAHMAHHDALTGLPNRVLLRTRMDQLLESSERARAGAVLLLDLDGFKQVNDLHGHLFGDALLRLVAGRLAGAVDGGDLLARLGGDEFAVVREGGLQPVDAATLAARLVEALRAPFEIEGAAVTIGTSIGVVASGGAGLTPELLLRNADIALYRAKAAGRARWCLYESRMESEMLARRALEHDLGQALAAAEFELHYQPIVEACSGAATGFEALLRWRHPVRGFVSPADFIPVCEETGLIRPIGAWVLERACADAAGWPGDATVAVNLSPAQFAGPELVAEVRHALEASGLPAGRLELEITESVLLRDDRANLAVLEDLHRLGVRIAMDDFGTGYSSLSYLRRFPFDKIKIDQSFVHSLSTRPETLAIVRAAIGLGRALGMTVLAEGVETTEQRDLLVAEGCHELQGYLFGRPRLLGETGMPCRAAA